MNLCKSGFADGMSKPIPYGRGAINSNLCVFSHSAEKILDRIRFF